MSNFNNNKDDELKGFRKAIVGLISVAVLSIVLILALYIYNFIAVGRADQEAFAQFGDYIGGVLNPIFGFLTIAILIYSIRIQSKELRVANEELELARGEMRVANETARKSANAMVKQTVMMEKRERIIEVKSLITFYNKRLASYKKQSWTIIGSGHTKLPPPSALPAVSFGEVINVMKKDSSNSQDYELKKYYLDFFEYLQYIASNGNFIDYIGQLRTICYDLAQSLSSLIELGENQSLCNIETQRILDEFSDFKDVALINENDYKSYLELIVESVKIRQSFDEHYPDLRRDSRAVVR